MPTIDQLFKQCFPFLKGISFDVFTVMSCIMSLLFIIIGIDFIKEILLRSYNSRLETSYLERADGYFNEAQSYSKNSAIYRQKMALGSRYVRKSLNYHRD